MSSGGDQKFAFVGGIITATAAAIIFLFANFETKAASSQRFESVEKWMERIELKIDKIIENTK